MLGPVFDEVLAAARVGAGWACTRLYEDLAGSVHGYLRRQGAAEPEDLTSEVFLGVFVGLDEFVGDEQQLRSWVFTIAHRRLVDERRRRSRRPRTEQLPADADPAGDPGAEATVVQLLDDERLLRHLDALGERHRDVLLLRVVADLSVAEAASVLGCSEAAVRQRQRRALRALRRSLPGARTDGNDSPSSRDRRGPGGPQPVRVVGRAPRRPPSSEPA